MNEKNEFEKEYNLLKYYIPSNKERYNYYLNYVLFRYLKNSLEIKKHIEEETLIDAEENAGIYLNNNSEVFCIVPKKRTVFDEIISIHEITHLINYLNNENAYTSKYSEVIPFFNEYNYLSMIDLKYKSVYEKFRFYSANNINNNYYFAYLILQKRKYDYNINFLNKVNSQEKNIEKKLIKHNYTN